MFLLRKPTDAQIRDYLVQQADQPFSYDCVGCTRGSPTTRRGWNIDAQRVLLGHGREVFRRAAERIDAWQMFPPEMATVLGRDKPRVGLVVAVVYRAAILPVWLVMPARVLYLIDETVDQNGHAVQRHGFAYGTLPGHPE